MYSMNKFNLLSYSFFLTLKNYGKELKYKLVGIMTSDWTT